MDRKESCELYISILLFFSSRRIPSARVLRGRRLRPPAGLHRRPLPEPLPGAEPVRGPAAVRCPRHPAHQDRRLRLSRGTPGRAGRSLRQGHCADSVPGDLLNSKSIGLLNNFMWE